MHRILAIAVAIVSAFAAGTANPSVVSYTDRAAFLAAVATESLTAANDDFESYALGNIPNGATRGAFRYTYDPAAVQPAIVSDGAGGQALGGAPFDVFVGGDSVTLQFVCSQPLLGCGFGADFFYAPSFDVIPGDTYRILIDDGTASGTFVGNANGLSADGGSFFLGLVADSGSAFSTVSLLSLPPTDTFLVPAYQVDNLVYTGRSPGGSVPAPATSWLLLSALALMIAVCPQRLSSQASHIWS